MTHRMQTIANARAESSATMFRAMQIDAQYRSSIILAHGAADRSELDQLARLCDVPRVVLAFDVADGRA